MLKFLNTPMPYTVAKQVMLEAYETFYGIYDHIRSPPDPLALLKKKEAEETFDSKYLSRLREFRAARVYERLGIDFDSFLDRPTYMIDKLLEGLAEEDKEKLPELNQLGKDIENLAK